MRIVLTFLAVAIVLLMSAALVGPMFVDWSQQRHFIEEELSRSLDAPVSVAGAIDARLLPTPYLTLANVHVGRGPGHTSLAARSVRLELAIGALAAGQIRFTEVSLEKPSLWLAMATDGSMARPGDTFVALARRLALDRVIVREGVAEIARPGGTTLTFSEIALDASAKSLAGPFRGSGAFAFASRRLRFEIVSSEFVGPDLPVKAQIDFGPSGPRAVLDGDVRFNATSAGFEPAYKGAVSVSGRVQTSEKPTLDWKASGSVDADLRGATVMNLTTSLGQDQRAVDAAGTAKFTFGPKPSLETHLKSKQLNLDSLLRRAGEDAAPPTRAFDFAASLAGAFGAAGAPPMAVLATLDTPAVYLGARTVENLKLALHADLGAPARGQIEFGLPGGGTFAFDGSLELGVAGALKGRLDAETNDPRTLADWTAEGDAGRGERLAALFNALPYAQIAAHGDIEASAAGFSLRNLKLSLDRSLLAGAVVFTEPTAGAKGRVFVDLKADLLDMDAAPDVTSAAAWLGDSDLSLALEASKLSIARLGRTRVDGGSLKVKASKTADRLSLDQFSLADLGGASVEAQGEAAAGSRWVRVKLDAARLNDFAQLAARVAPGPYSRWLASRADALSPARLTLEARQEGGPPAAGGFPFDFLKAEGEAGGARFALRLGNAPAPVDALTADLTWDAPDGAVLLRQLGIGPRALNLGRAHVAATASGKPGAGFDSRATVSFAGADALWQGRITPDAKFDEPLFSGSATLKSSNVVTALAAFGLAPTGAAAVAGDLTTDLLGKADSVAANKVSGTLGASKVSGALTWRAPPPLDATSIEADVAIAQSIAGETPNPTAAGLSGELSIDRLALSALASVPFGPLAASKSGAGWSDVRFGPPSLVLPGAQVKLKVAALDLADGSQAKNLEARVRLDTAKFEVCEVALDLPTGHASGCATIRRDGPSAAISGTLTLDPTAFDRAALRGRIGGSLDFASAGESPAALMSGLVGQGRVAYTGLAVARLDPGALGRVVAKAQQADAFIDETNINHALSVELDRQPLALPDGEAALLLNGGVLRLGPITVTGPDRRAEVSGEFDLRNAELRVQSLFEVAQGGKFWSGAPPAIVVRVTGPADAPTRTIDDALFAAGLSAQAIARESDRIANLESDLRERAYFNRRLKAGRFMQQRELEISEFQQEQARLKFLAERKRVEDALLQADEERKKAEAEAAAAAAAKAAALAAAKAAASAAAAAAAKVDATPKAAPQPAETSVPAPTAPDPAASGLY